MLIDRLARRPERLAAFGSACLLFGAWEAAGRSGLVDRLILPPPSAVVATAVKGLLLPGQTSYPILFHLLSSMKLLVTGFALGAVLALLVGVVLGLSSFGQRLVGPVLGMLLPIPAIAWAPVVLVWIGPGPAAVVALVTYACFSEVVYNTVAGVRATPPRFLWVIDTFGAGPLARILRVVLPAAAPQIFVGLKLGLAASWRALVGAEMFAGVAMGLGFMLYEAREFYATDVMFASLLLVAAISLLIEQVAMRWIEQRTLARWGMAQRLEA